jgi:hypothetical protein
VNRIIVHFVCVYCLERGDTPLLIGKIIAETKQHFSALYRKVTSENSSVVGPPDVEKSAKNDHNIFGTKRACAHDC